MVAVHAGGLLGTLLEELGGHLGEHGVGEHVLLLDGVLGGLGLHLLHLRLQQVGRAAGDGRFVAQDLLGELGADGRGGAAVVAVDQALDRKSVV